MALPISRLHVPHTSNYTEHLCLQILPVVKVWLGRYLCVTAGTQLRPLSPGGKLLEPAAHPIGEGRRAHAGPSLSGEELAAHVPFPSFA